MKEMFTKRNEHTVTGSNKSPEKEDYYQGTQCSVIGWNVCGR
jgi:hypothetical protein